MSADALGQLSDQQKTDAVNQRIFETSLDLIMVVDRAGTFIRLSPSSCAILGYHPDELIGRFSAGHHAWDFLRPSLAGYRTVTAFRGRESRQEPLG